MGLEGADGFKAFSLRASGLSAQNQSDKLPTRAARSLWSWRSPEGLVLALEVSHLSWLGPSVTRGIVPPWFTLSRLGQARRGSGARRRVTVPFVSAAQKNPLWFLTLFA